MNDPETQLRFKTFVGYMEHPNTCAICQYFEEDMTTDNFGPGDKCVRNPDFNFSVRKTGCCRQWSPKTK